MRDTRRVEPPPASQPGQVLSQAAGDPPTVLPVSVAVLPLGTSNDFAACTGIPTVRRVLSVWGCDQRPPAR